LPWERFAELFIRPDGDPVTSHDFRQEGPAMLAQVIGPDEKFQALVGRFKTSVMNGRHLPPKPMPEDEVSQKIRKRNINTGLARFARLGSRVRNLSALNTTLAQAPEVRSLLAASQGADDNITQAVRTHFRTQVGFSPETTKALVSLPEEMDALADEFGFAVDALAKADMNLEAVRHKAEELKTVAQSPVFHLVVSGPTTLAETAMHLVQTVIARIDETFSSMLDHNPVPDGPAM